MKIVQASASEDGTLFDNEVAAMKHDLFLKRDNFVEEFLNSEMNTYQAKTSRPVAKNTVYNWSIWLAKKGENDE